MVTMFTIAMFRSLFTGKSEASELRADTIYRIVRTRSGRFKLFTIFDAFRSSRFLTFTAMLNSPSQRSSSEGRNANRSMVVAETIEKLYFGAFGITTMGNRATQTTKTRIARFVRHLLRADKQSAPFATSDRALGWEKIHSVHSGFGSKNKENKPRRARDRAFSFFRLAIRFSMSSALLIAPWDSTLDAELFALDRSHHLRELRCRLLRGFLEACPFWRFVELRENEELGVSEGVEGSVSSSPSAFSALVSVSSGFSSLSAVWASSEREEFADRS